MEIVLIKDSGLNWTDIVGILGFVLSLCIAISQALSARLKITCGPITYIETKKAPDSVFLFLCLSNRKKTPFSLIDVYIDFGKHIGTIPIEKTVRTYQNPHPNKGEFPVKPVVLSPAFPVRFDSYASELLLIELSRQHIGTKLLRQDASIHNPAEHLHTLSLRIRKRYIPQPHPRLMLSTSRGRRAIPIQIDSVQGWDYLEKYAVQKAGHENKIVFPN